MWVKTNHFIFAVMHLVVKNIFFLQYINYIKFFVSSLGGGSSFY